MKRYSKVLLLLFCLVAAQAGAYTAKNMNTLTFPYTVQNGDSLFQTDDTLTSNSGFFVIPTSITSAFINFNDKVCKMDNDHTGGAVGITVQGNATGYTVRRGYLIMDTVANAGSDTAKRHGLPIQNMTGIRITNSGAGDFDTMRIVVDGHNANCVELLNSGMLNVRFDSCSYTNWSQSFDSRETVGSAAIFSESLTKPASSANFNAIFKHCKVLKSPQCAWMVKGKLLVDSCVGNVDAINRRWDSIYLWGGGGVAPVGSSADNCYILICRGGVGGTIIRDCRFNSGTTNEGSRGILLENLSQTSATDSFYVLRDTFMLHGGPTGENPTGVIRGARFRAIDGGTCKYFSVVANVMYIYGDVNSATSSYGQEAFGFQMTGSGSVSNGTIANNRIRAVNLSTSSSCHVEPMEYDGSNYQTNNLVLKNNRYWGSHYIGYFHDAYNGGSVSNYYSIGDTLSKIDSTTDALFIGVKFPGTFATLYVGGDASRNWSGMMQDVTYTNGASESNLVFGGNSTAAWTFKRTLSVRVEDANHVAVSGATVTVTDANSHVQSTGTTTATGTVTPAVTYNYQEDHITASVDSTYNDFSIRVQKSPVDTTTTLTVSSTSNSKTVTLGGTNPAPTFSIILIDTSGIEGNVIRAISVRSDTTGGSSTYYVITRNGTATAGSDYTSIDSVLFTFAALSFRDTIPISTTADNAIEPDETFRVVIKTPSVGTIADSSATITIINDDLPTYSVADTFAVEGDSAVITITLAGASYRDETFSYATGDSTANSLQDYVAKSGSATITAGQTTKLIKVYIVSDGIYEADAEYFKFNISNFGHSGVATNSFGVIRIPANGAPSGVRTLIIGGGQ